MGLRHQMGLRCQNRAFLGSNPICYRPKANFLTSLCLCEMQVLKHLSSRVIMWILLRSSLLKSLCLIAWYILNASLVAQMVKSLPVVRETQV